MLYLKEDLVPVPESKNIVGGIFEAWYCNHLIQHIGWCIMRLHYHETSESKLFDETKSLNSHCLLLKGQVTLLFYIFSLSFVSFF